MIRVLILLALSFAHAYACAIEWDYSETDQKKVDGFQFEIDGIKTVRIARELRRVDCSLVGDIKAPHIIRLYAYRRDEYSQPSNTVEYQP
jgi:hypothetical protein